MKKTLLFLFISFFLSVPSIFAEEVNIQEEVFYDILIDRFYIGDPNLSEQVRSDDPYAYHGGDLQGITQKLDWLKRLGFTSIVLSPIQENALDGYHGYWIEDFYKLNPEYGTMDDLHKLIKEAHKRDIKIILELVTNYVAKSHPFVTDKNKQDWFKTNEVKQIPATKWLENVALLDQNKEEVEEYLIDVAKYWMDEADFDGFKLQDADQSSLTFIENLTKEIKNINPTFYLIAGISERNAPSEMLKKNTNIDAVENRLLFEAMNEVFTKVGEPISHLYDVWVDSGDQTDVLFVDNKNTARYSNNVAENGRGTLNTWQLTLVYMYTTPGVPVILQGSELPMYGPSFKESQRLANFNSTNPDLEEFHERISSLRQEFPSLTLGDFKHVGSKGAMSVFKRSYENETTFIAINNGDESRTIVVDDLQSDLELRGFLEDNLIRANKEGEYLINIPRESAEIFIVQKNTGINWFFITPILGIFIIFIVSVIYLTKKQKKEAV